jgi:hypothetical protein
MDREWSNRHSAELSQCFETLSNGDETLTSNGIASCTYLPDNCALEHYEHEECEKAVVPVFVEHPEGYAENLENEERRGSMLRKQRAERRNWDVELVFSIH